MANRQRAEARRKAQAKAARASGEGGSAKIWMWIVVAVVLVGGGIAIAAAMGGDDGGSASNTTDTNPFLSLPDSQPVTVTGTALTPYDSKAATDTAIGTVAPVIEGLNFQGEAVKIDAAADGPYMVVFLAHWCPHCNVEIPRLLDWKLQGGVPEGLKIVGVGTAVSSSSVNYPPAEWFNVKGWSWPVLVDQSTGDGAAGVAAQAYGATGWPYFVIVGADGKVKARVSGEVSINDLQQIVADALAS